MADVTCELINSMGSDLTVVNAARVSMAKESGWVQQGINEDETLDGVERKASYEWYVDCPSLFDDQGVALTCFMLSGKDAKLVSYLAKHEHWTPFAHCQITLRETVPIFVARQRFKHTVGFVYNEISRRYVDDEPEFYTPKVWRKRAENIKQGSLDEPVDKLLGAGLSYTRALGYAKETYNQLLAAGVAPEQARMVLPQSMMTSYYVTGSLAAFARAYKLRIDPHAQREIQDLAVLWDDIIRPLFPVSWEALTKGD